MAYKVIILYRLYMPSYFLGTFTEYPKLKPPLFDTTFVYLDTCSIVLRLNSGGFFYINLKNERSHEFKNTLLQSYNPVPI